MKEMLIGRYRRIRSYRELESQIKAGFAFVGAGHHSRQNLYPIIDYLHLPLMHICITDKAKAVLIQESWGVHTTTSIEDILSDPQVRGVFVSARPESHFALASKVLSARKSLFIEKPPCMNSGELAELSRLAAEAGVHVVVGMQRRYSPSVGMLRKKLQDTNVLSYHMRYGVGAYPEGNPVTDLYIHPLDMLCYLFGEAQAEYVSKTSPENGVQTISIVLKHKGVVGFVELSTAYSWTAPKDSLQVNTLKGEYILSVNESLVFVPRPKTILGIPMEKLLAGPVASYKLCSPSPDIPVLANNQLYTQGFYGEVETFARLLGGAKGKSLSTFDDMKPVYSLLDSLSAL